MNPAMSPFHRDVTRGSPTRRQQPLQDPIGVWIISSLMTLVLVFDYHSRCRVTNGDVNSPDYQPVHRSPPINIVEHFHLL